MTRPAGLPAALVFFLTAAAAEARPELDRMAQDARAILEALVGFDTTQGNEVAPATWVRDLLRKEGISADVLTPDGKRGNLVARLPGTGARRPVLLLAHLDTVNFIRQEWRTDPLKLTEKDGALYGRGVGDDKGMAAVLTAALLALKRHGPKLSRDVILALTADEEAGGDPGLSWLLREHRARVDAEFALNEGGYLKRRGGSLHYAAVQFAEKGYLDVELVARGTGGHSSRPVPGNPIHRLARAMARVSGLRFAARITDDVRTFLRGLARVMPPAFSAKLVQLADHRGEPPPALVDEVSADPEVNAALRTTCVATLVRGGSRVNVLPTQATATLNCRLSPGDSGDGVLARLREIIADPHVELRAERPADTSGASPLSGPGYEAVITALQEQYGDAPIVPIVSRGSTDSRHLRALGIHAYGLMPIPLGNLDAPTMHAPNERIPADGLREAAAWVWKFLMAADRAGPELVRGPASTPGAPTR